MASEHLFWSRHGKVACAAHAPPAGSTEWISAGWRPCGSGPGGSRLTLQCQECSGKGPIRWSRRQTERPRSAPERTLAARLFIVDAFRDEREMYAEYLEATGFEVHVFEEPARAFAEATVAAPDVLVTRVPQYTGGDDGIALTARLRDHAITRDVAIIVVTTTSSELQRQAAQRAGCDGYLVMPTPPNELVSEIRRVMRTRALQRVRPEPMRAEPPIRRRRKKGT